MRKVGRSWNGTTGALVAGWLLVMGPGGALPFAQCSDCDRDIDEEPGCLRDCPFPDAQAPALPALLGSGNITARPAWNGQILGLASTRLTNGRYRVRLTRYSLAGTLLGHTDLGGLNWWDGVSERQGDCDDVDATIRPFAIPLCDGLSNDCNTPSWPELAATEEAAGGACEVAGGQLPDIDLTLTADGMLRWQSATAFPGWNVYRGDIADLKCDLIPVEGSYNCSCECYQHREVCRPRGGWMQPPGSNALATRSCDVPGTSMADEVALSPGQIATYLVTGVVAAGPDGALGA